MKNTCYELENEKSNIKILHKVFQKKMKQKKII